MAGILQGIKKVIHETTTEIIDGELSTKTANVLNTLVDSVFKLVDDVLLSIQDLTKASPPPPAPTEEEEPETP